MAYYEGTTQGTVTFFDDSSAQFRLLWTISDYLKVQERGGRLGYIELQEPVSVIPGKSCLGLELYPNGNEETLNDPNYTGIVLKNKGTNNTWVEFEVSILDKNMKQQCISRDFERTLLEPGSSWGWSEWFPSTAPSRNPNMFLTNGSLQVLVIGTIFTNEQMCLEVPQSESARNPHENNVSTFHVSFVDQSNELSDAILSIEEEKFQVHKCILSKRSSVFEEMFKTESPNILVIPDMSADVLRQVLQFIYTDSVTAAIDTMLPEVLKAADKYKLDYLKDICQIKMIKNISVSNAVGYLRVAEKASAPQLKKKAFDFIVKNRCEVSREESWKAFMSEKSDLLLELMNRFMQN